MLEVRVRDTCSVRLRRIKTPDPRRGLMAGLGTFGV
jgi:hypothetical protein